MYRVSGNIGGGGRLDIGSVVVLAVGSYRVYGNIGSGRFGVSGIIEGRLV